MTSPHPGNVWFNVSSENLCYSQTDSSDSRRLTALRRGQRGLVDGGGANLQTWTSRDWSLCPVSHLLVTSGSWDFLQSSTHNVQFVLKLTLQCKVETGSLQATNTEKSRRACLKWAVFIYSGYWTFSWKIHVRQMIIQSISIFFKNMSGGNVKGQERWCFWLNTEKVNTL